MSLPGEAWFCPACQKHHAPHVETCPAPVDLISKDRMPVLPSIPPSHWSKPSDWLPDGVEPFVPLSWNGDH